MAYDPVAKRIVASESMETSVSPTIAFSSFSVRAPTKELRARRFHEQPAPTDEKKDSADGRNGAEPKNICSGQYIKRAGEKENAGKKTPPGAGLEWFPFREYKEHYRVDE